MKQTIKNIIGITMIFSIMFMVSCEKDFDEINKDPNAITDVPAEYLLPGSIMNLSNAEHAFMEGLVYASDWVQHTSCGLWIDPGRYFFEKSRSFMWDNLYSGPLMDLKVMKTKAREEKNQSLEAVAIILQAYGYSLLVDVYGAVPFSQALSAEQGINKPVYDDGETIYKSLIDSLGKANELLKSNELIVSEEYDVLCDGDALKWRKFCNSLKLRLLVRASKKIPAYSKDQLTNFYNNPDYPLLQSNLDNMAFDYPATSPQTNYPLHDALSESSSDGGYRISNRLVEIMTALNDPRLAEYAMPNKDGEIQGLANGSSVGSAELDDYSKLSPQYGMKDRAGIFITYSEVQFLLAEAAESDLIVADEALLYEKAIEANFDDLGLSSSDFQTFIQQSNVAYTDYERLITQKWISLFGRGLEAWIEYKRTGIPDLDPALYANLQTIPSRFLYPLSEEQSNKANLMDAASKLTNGDALDSRIWWMN